MARKFFALSLYFVRHVGCFLPNLTRCVLSNYRGTKNPLKTTWENLFNSIGCKVKSLEPIITFFLALFKLYR